MARPLSQHTRTVRHCSPRIPALHSILVAAASTSPRRCFDRLRQPPTVVLPPPLRQPKRQNDPWGRGLNILACLASASKYNATVFRLTPSSSCPLLHSSTHSTLLCPSAPLRLHYPLAHTHHTVLLHRTTQQHRSRAAQAAPPLCMLAPRCHCACSAISVILLHRAGITVSLTAAPTTMRFVAHVTSPLRLWLRDLLGVNVVSCHSWGSHL